MKMNRREFVCRSSLGIAAATVLPVAAVESQKRDNLSTEPIDDSESSLFKTTPYLQNATGNSMTIAWSTVKACYSWVEYGETSDLDNKAHTIVDGQIISNNELNKIKVINLKAGSEYFYRVCSKEILSFGAYKVKWGKIEKSPICSFMTVKEGGDKFTCIFFNDLHNNYNLYNALVERNIKCSYDLSIFNGDCFNDPANEDQVVKALNIYNRGVKANQIPVIYLRGNHEIRGAYSRLWSRHFSTPKSKQYYALTRGPLRFVFLDCGEDKNDDHWAYSGLNDFSGFRAEQAEWLRKEIKSPEYQSASFRVLVHHIPLFWNNTGKPTLWDEWKKIVNNAGVDLAISGHTHKHMINLPNTMGKHDFPCVIGGGKKMEDGTLTLLKATKKELKVEMLGAKGEILEKLKLKACVIS